MTTIKINGSRHNLPTNWNDVTYSQYVGFLSIDYSLPGFLSLFTGLSTESLYKAHIDSVDDAWKTLSFLSVPPEFKPKPTDKVGPYKVRDIVITTLGQLDDLNQLLRKAPSPVVTVEDNLSIANLYLEACAICTTKNKYGSYDQSKVMEVKEEIKSYSSIEVLQTGAFFLCWALKSQQPQQLN